MRRLLVGSLAIVLAARTADAAEAKPAARCVTSPETFAPEVISLTGSHDDYVSFSPRGDMVIFTRLDKSYDRGTLYASVRGRAGWTAPRKLPFSGAYSDSRAAFSSDGKTVVFASNRPRETSGAERPDLDLWVVSFKRGRWGDPRPLPGDVNTPFNETHPSLARDGTLYFVRYGRGMLNKNDIFAAPRARAEWRNAQPIAEINSPVADSHVWVDPNQRLLLFARGGTPTGDDIYFSIREGSRWSPPERLPAPVNSKDYDYSAKVSPDGKRLFFSRNGAWTGGGPADLMSVPLCAVPEIAAALRRGKSK